jgi:hypothetical protein
MSQASWFFACRSQSFLMVEPGQRSLFHHKVVGRAEENRMMRPENRLPVVNGPVGSRTQVRAEISSSVSLWLRQAVGVWPDQRRKARVKALASE